MTPLSYYILKGYTHLLRIAKCVNRTISYC